jgi:MoxR-like ATPase
MTLQQQFRDIEDYLNRKYYERPDAIEGLIYAILTRQHFLFLGPVGTAKSALARELFALFGARTYANQLHLLSQMEELFGPIDMKQYEPSGECVRQIDGFLPACDMAVLEEIDKAGPAIFGTMLTVLNERKYKHGGTEIDVPLTTAVGNLNALPDDPTGALWDRWLVRCQAQYLTSPAHFLSMMRGEHLAHVPPKALRMRDLQAAIGQVRAVAIPDDVLSRTWDIKQQLRSAGITPSDRRWEWSRGVIKAAAWMDDRQAATVDDLTALRHTLWLMPEQIETVHSLVLQFSNPRARRILEIGQALDEIAASLARHDWPDRAMQHRWAISSRGALTAHYKEMRSFAPDVSGRLGERLQLQMDRIPDLGAQIMVASNLVGSPEAADAAIRTELAGI